MDEKRFRLLSLFSLLVLLIALLGNPPVGLAAGNVCNWTGGSGLDYYWEDADNWACTEGSGPPDEDADVIVASIQANGPLVTGAASAKSLTLSSGYLTINPGASLTVSDTWTNLGSATIDSQGALYGNGEVNSSGTFHFLSSGTIYGDLSIDALATASVAVVYMHGNVINNGVLYGEDVDAQFHMLGALFTNSGTVSVNEFYFEKGGGAVQQVNGSGAWDTGIDFLFVTNNTHLTAGSNVTFKPQHFSISDDGSLLNVGIYTVTFKAPAEVTNSGSITGSPGGSIHTQDEAVTIIVPNEGYFYPPLVLENGVTRASGVFSGTINVGQEATLRVMAAPAGMITANRDVTVDGVLDGDNDMVSFVMKGQKLTVDGLVTVAGLDLQGISKQDITGTGSLDLHNLSVDAPGGVNLGVPLTLDGALALNGNVYAGSSAVVTLDESAITTGSTTDKDIFGTVQRNGPFIKDKTYSFGNLNLALTFTNVGSGLPVSVTMTVRQNPWKDLSGSIKRSYTIQSSGGSGWLANLSLDYRDSELHGFEDFLQVWRRPSSSAVWTRLTYSEANFNQNWIKFEGLTHFSDWGLCIHSVFIPAVSK